MSKDLATDLYIELGFVPTLDYDKMTYIKNHPDHLVVYNCNIFVKDIGKIWHGDLDITEHNNMLCDLATKYNTVLYCLKEKDGRFENENRKDFDKVAVWSTAK
jgi:hypothetical protein